MQAAAAAPAPPPPPPPPRRRVYTALDPRCEWKSTEEADTLVVDVSGNALQLAIQRCSTKPVTSSENLNKWHPSFRVQEGGAEGPVQHTPETQGRRRAPGRRRPMGTLPQGVPGAEELRRQRHRGEDEHRERPALRHPAQGITAAAAAAVVVQGQAQRR